MPFIVSYGATHKANVHMVISGEIYGFEIISSIFLLALTICDI